MEDPIPYLLALRRHHSQAEIARVMDTTARTVRRWETRETDPPPYLLDALRQRLLLPQEQRTPAGHAAFRFIDLFAGLCVVFSLSGLLLLQRHAGNRPLTWPLTALGLLLPLLLALLFIH